MAKKNVCEPGKHSSVCIGVTLLVVGVLVILNDMYSWLTWGTFIGGLIAIKGLVKMVHPNYK